MGVLQVSSITPLLSFNSAACRSSSSPESAITVANKQPFKINVLNRTRQDTIIGPRTGISRRPRIWELHSTLQIENMALTDEDKKKWDACREVLSTFEFSLEDIDKILGKAFGHIHSPYWSEERRKEVPDNRVVNETLDFLRSLNLTDEDLRKLLKKFPEVLGCSLENELRENVKILEKDWGIEGKTLRSLLLRNPKVLGYNVDCKGDCMAQCTRCWVRF